MFLSFLYPELLKHNCHITFCEFKMYDVLFDTLTYCNIIITITLSNTSVISHNYHFFFVLGTFKIYSPKNFQNGTVNYNHNAMH